MSSKARETPVSMQRILTLAFAVAMIAGAADAKFCRDAHGKFIRCRPPVHGMPGGHHRPCRDKHGKFVRCPVPLTSNQQHAMGHR
jgi:hypothetical protein